MTGIPFSVSIVGNICIQLIFILVVDIPNSTKKLNLKLNRTESTLIM